MISSGINKMQVLGVTFRRWIIFQLIIVIVWYKGACKEGIKKYDGVDMVLFTTNEQGKPKQLYREYYLYRRLIDMVKLQEKDNLLVHIVYMNDDYGILNSVNNYSDFESSIRNYINSPKNNIKFYHKHLYYGINNLVNKNSLTISDLSVRTDASKRKLDWLWRKNSKKILIVSPGEPSELDLLYHRYTNKDYVDFGHHGLLRLSDKINAEQINNECRDKFIKKKDGNYKTYDSYGEKNIHSRNTLSLLKTVEQIANSMVENDITLAYLHIPQVSYMIPEKEYTSQNFGLFQQIKLAILDHKKAIVYCLTDYVQDKRYEDYLHDQFENPALIGLITASTIYMDLSYRYLVNATETIKLSEAKKCVRFNLSTHILKKGGDVLFAAMHSYTPGNESLSDMFILFDSYLNEKYRVYRVSRPMTYMLSDKHNFMEGNLNANKLNVKLLMIGEGNSANKLDYSNYILPFLKKGVCIKYIERIFESNDNYSTHNILDVVHTKYMKSSMNLPSELIPLNYINISHNAKENKKFLVAYDKVNELYPKFNNINHHSSPKMEQIYAFSHAFFLTRQYMNNKNLHSNDTYDHILKLLLSAYTNLTSYIYHKQNFIGEIELNKNTPIVLNPHFAHQNSGLNYMDPLIIVPFTMLENSYFLLRVKKRTKCPYFGIVFGIYYQNAFGDLPFSSLNNGTYFSPRLLLNGEACIPGTEIPLRSCAELNNHFYHTYSPTLKRFEDLSILNLEDYYNKNTAFDRLSTKHFGFHELVNHLNLPFLTQPIVSYIPSSNSHLQLHSIRKSCPSSYYLRSSYKHHLDSLNTNSNSIPVQSPTESIRNWRLGRNYTNDALFNRRTQRIGPKYYDLVPSESDDAFITAISNNYKYFTEDLRGVTKKPIIEWPSDLKMKNCSSLKAGETDSFYLNIPIVNKV